MAYTWRNGTFIDGFDANSFAFYDSTNDRFVVGDDTGGYWYINPGTPSLAKQFNRGSAIASSGASPGWQQHACSFISNGTTHYAIAGVGSNNVTLKRTDTTDWAPVDTTYGGDVHSSAGDMRPVGAQRMAFDSSGNLFASVFNGSGIGGLVKIGSSSVSVVNMGGSSSFTSSKTNDHRFSALCKSAKFSNVILVAADIHARQGAAAQTPGANGAGVWIVKSTNGTPAFVQIDAVAGAPGGTGGCLGMRDIVAVDEGTTHDVYYAVVSTDGDSGATARGVWKIDITDPTVANPTVSWTKLNGSSGTALYVNGDLTNIVARRSGANTFLAVAMMDPSGTTNGSSFWSGTGNYKQTHWRSLDSGATWGSFTNAANYSLASNGYPKIWGTADTGWAGANNKIGTFNNPPGGAACNTWDLALKVAASTANDVIVHAGRAIHAICTDPWGTTPTWSLIGGASDIICYTVKIDPVHPGRLAVTDADRSIHTWNDGGVGNSANQISTHYDSLGKQRISGIDIDEDGYLWAGQDKFSPSKIFVNNRSWWQSDAGWSSGYAIVNSAGDASGVPRVAAWKPTSGTKCVLAMVTGSNVAGIYRMRDSDSTFTQQKANTITDGCDLLGVPGTAIAFALLPDGLYRTTNAATTCTFTRIHARATNGGGQHGRIAYDAHNDILYAQYGIKDGVYKITGATAATPGTPAQLTDSGVGLTSSTDVGPIAVDAVTNDLMMCVLGSTAAKCLRMTAAGVFTDETNTAYVEALPQPCYAAMGGGRMYAVTDQNGVFLATSGTTDTTAPGPVTSLLPQGGTGGGTPTVVSGSPQSARGANLAPTIPLPTSVDATEVLAATVLWSGTATFTPPAGWQTTQTAAPGAGLNIWRGYYSGGLPSAAAGALSVSNRWVASSIKVAGGIPAGPVDVSAVSSSLQTVAAAGAVTGQTVTTTGATELLIHAYGLVQTTASTTVNVWTLDAATASLTGDMSRAPSSVNVSLALASEAKATAGATTARSATTAEAGSALSSVIAYLPAPPGASVGATATTMPLSWVNPSDTDFDHVIIRRKAGSTAPTSATDGRQVANVTGTPSAAGTYTDTGLTASTTYSYSLFTVDTTGNVSSTATSTTVITGAVTDTQPPATPTALTAVVNGNGVLLSWTNPPDSDLSQIVVYSNAGVTAPSYSSGAFTGTLVQTVSSPTPSGTSTATDSNLANGSYTYGVFSIDASGNVQPIPATVLATINVDTTPPGPVTGLTVSAKTGSSVTLAWTDPTDADLNLLPVRYIAGGTAPTAVDGGFDGGTASRGARTITVTGLSVSTTYSFSVFTRDAAGNTSTTPTVITVTTAGTISMPAGLTTLTLRSQGAAITGVPSGGGGGGPGGAATLVKISGQETAPDGTPARQVHVEVTVVAPDGTSTVYRTDNKTAVSVAAIVDAGSDANGYWTLTVPAASILSPAGCKYRFARTVTADLGGSVTLPAETVTVDGSVTETTLAALVLAQRGA